MERWGGKAQGFAMVLVLSKRVSRELQEGGVTKIEKGG